MAILRKTLEWLLGNIPFTIKVTILFTKFPHIKLQDKSNFEQKAKILLLANTNQTLQI